MTICNEYSKKYFHTKNDFCLSFFELGVKYVMEIFKILFENVPHYFFVFNFKNFFMTVLIISIKNNNVTSSICLGVLF